jgi:hypothetical protein
VAFLRYRSRANHFVRNEALDLLRATAAEEDHYVTQASQLQSVLDEGFASLREPVGDRLFVVDELRSPTSSCIVAVGEIDLTTTASDPPQEVIPYAAVLHRLDRDAVNETGWGFAQTTALLEGREPYDPEEVCP